MIMSDFSGFVEEIQENRWQVYGLELWQDDQLENVMIPEYQRVTTYSIVVIAKEKATSRRFIRDAKSS